jgi:hypothetical protein
MRLRTGDRVAYPSTTRDLGTVMPDGRRLFVVWDTPQGPGEPPDIDPVTPAGRLYLLEGADEVLQVRLLPRTDEQRQRAADRAKRRLAFWKRRKWEPLRRAARGLGTVVVLE